MGVIDPQERARASGFVETSIHLSFSIAAPIGGYVMKNFSLDLPFYFSSASLIVAAILVYVFFSKYDKTLESPQRV